MNKPVLLSTPNTLVCDLQADISLPHDFQTDAVSLYLSQAPSITVLFSRRGLNAPYKILLTISARLNIAEHGWEMNKHCTLLSGYYFSSSKYHEHQDCLAREKLLEWIYSREKKKFMLL